MKTYRYIKTLALAAAVTGAITSLSSCGAMLSTSVGVSADTYPGAVGGWWDDGSYFPPYWAGSIAGPPAWGVGAPPRPVAPAHPITPPPGTVKPYPTGPGPVVGGSGLPGENTKPVTPPAGSFRPYPTGPGPVVGGTGLPTLPPGNNNSSGNATTTEPGRRPVRR